MTEQYVSKTQEYVWNEKENDRKLSREKMASGKEFGAG